MYKLGKKQARFDERTLKFAKYKTLAPTPAEVSWVMKVSNWPMMLNDELGDCVVAASGHMEEQWSFYANSPGYVPTDNQILRAYEQIGGYRPNDPSTDNGCDMLTALKVWRKTGIAGHKISAFVQVDTKNLEEVMQSIYLFGNIYLGFDLPMSVAPTESGVPAWTVPDGGLSTQNGAAGGLGGHCVPAMAASPQSLTVITWGQRLKCSWNFLKLYCDEAYCVLSPDWIEKSGVSPSNFNLAQLQKDLSVL